MIAKIKEWLTAQLYGQSPLLILISLVFGICVWAWVKTNIGVE